MVEHYYSWLYKFMSSVLQFFLPNSWAKTSVITNVMAQVALTLILTNEILLLSRIK